MRKIVNIDFSPFTAMAYRCLNDFLKGVPNDVFRMHFLGINLPYDRFHIIFLEKLFERYSARHVMMTYDSINYIRTAQLNFKNMEIFDFNGSDLEYYQGILSAPPELVKKIYIEEHQYKDTESEIDNVRQNQRLDDSNVFSPMNIYSNISLDRFFSYIIEKYGMIDLLFRFRNVIGFKHELGLITGRLSSEYPEVFNKAMISVILSNMEITFKFHTWFTTSRKDDDLEQLISVFIEMIDFPKLIK